MHKYFTLCKKVACKYQDLQAMKFLELGFNEPLLKHTVFVSLLQSYQAQYSNLEMELNSRSFEQVQGYLYIYQALLVPQ
ncbi:MAG: hypothetical protein COA74_11755 [Gammaproteobacteria bacterium]|nr:MAG: hypothetical protein COA74_11755 [Gammaproteobacteria bacterium]